MTNILLPLLKIWENISYIWYNIYLFDLYNFFFQIFEKANLGLSGAINLELKYIYISKLYSYLIIKIGAVNRIMIQTNNLKLFNYII